jgi:hypothetical protein
MGKMGSTKSTSKKSSKEVIKTDTQKAQEAMKAHRPMSKISNKLKRGAVYAKVSLLIKSLPPSSATPL